MEYLKAIFHYSSTDLPTLPNMSGPFRKRSTIEGVQHLDESQVIQLATDAFVRELGLDDDYGLKDKIEIREVPAGTYLMKEDSHKVRIAPN